MHHEGNESLTNEVGCHAWNDGVRLVGIKAGGSIRAGLNKGPDAHQLIKKHWCELLLSVKQMAEVGFRELIKVGDQWFTQRPRVGDGMDQWEPEFVVTSLEKIGEPVLFRTEIGGYHGFFKYGVKEVEEIAPPTANAYVFMGEVTIEWLDGNPMYHNAMTQFYRVTVDATQRLMREKELKNDYETMMKLLTK